MISAPSSREEDDEEERLICVLWCDSGELVLFALRVRAQLLSEELKAQEAAHHGTHLELFIFVALLGLASAAC